VLAIRPPGRLPALSDLRRFRGLHHYSKPIRGPGRSTLPAPRVAIGASVLVGPIRLVVELLEHV
jgi:hypothetical protein